ncbi:hypothetical protein Hanom_Chr10g00942811 [Helianthus anomalus]
MSRLHYFIHVDSSWQCLFELAHTPSYWELLLEFLSTFTFHPPRADQPPTQPQAPPPLPEVSFTLAGVWRLMMLAEFLVHSGLYMQEEIATAVYTQGLVVVDRHTLLGFWQVVAGADTWEYVKTKGRNSHVDDPLYRYIHRMLSTSITTLDHNHEWCTSTDLVSSYRFLYMRSCALAHGLA